jgi:hypothetical protein
MLNSRQIYSIIYTRDNIPFALYAHFWQYVRPCSTFVLQLVQELEYAAYGFFADFERSLLYSNNQSIFHT